MPFNALINLYHQGYIVCNLFFLIYFIFNCIYHIHRKKKFPRWSVIFVNPFLRNVSFLYPLKELEIIIP